jgi:hypothetical protein
LVTLFFGGVTIGRNFTPLHPDAKGITISEVEDYEFDGRLWKKI